MSEGLQKMRAGARWKLFVPPRLAYGTAGPLAYRTVIIDVELDAIEGPDETTQRSRAVGGSS